MRAATVITARLFWYGTVFCALLIAASFGCASHTPGAPRDVPPASEPRFAAGPFIGHVDPTGARIWARLATPGHYRIVARDDAGNEHRVTADALEANDRCVVWELSDLTPATGYTFAIDREGRALRCDDELFFATAPTERADGETRLFFGSCAREDNATRATLRQALAQDPDVVVLLGDTPYINAAKLAKQRKRYQQFAAVPELADLLRTRPWYGTWDDHDFGTNDCDGRVPGKQDVRRAFIEYHANPSYGDGSQGIYTRFRRGPIEVFLLDTRYFAATEPSPYRQHHASLLGAKQWQWLRAGLLASTAPVKVLACGMIWNGAVRPNKLDHWESYAYERDALFDFIGEHAISGVVLVGGDIHRSRVIRHASAARAGYDIVELITSPLHGGIIETANAPHPGLIVDLGEPQCFLLLDATVEGGVLSQLQARFVNAEGRELFRLDPRR